MKTASAELIKALQREGFEHAEVFAKSSRSRHYELSAAGELVVASEETGWAVRASHGEGSFFLRESGEPRVPPSWPKAEGPAWVFSPRRPGPSWKEPREIEAPLLSERDGVSFLTAVAAELGREAPGCRLLSATLDDGASESRLASHHDGEVRWRSRLAAVHLEAATPQGLGASLAAAEREARAFAPKALARRLADRLAVAQDGGAAETGRFDCLLSPVVGSRLLAGLLPLFLDAAGLKLLLRYADRAGRVASPAWTVIDDGRYSGGPLEAPYDGEGQPTGSVVLLDGGGQPRSLEGSGLGVWRRPSWRDLPALGPSHFYLAPKSRVSVAGLLSGLETGYYFIDAPGPGSFDLEGDHFRLAVRGFSIHQGRAQAPVAPAYLTGSLASLFQGLKATARDLAFLPLSGMIGSPTLLFSGLEVSGG